MESADTGGRRGKHPAGLADLAFKSVTRAGTSTDGRLPHAFREDALRLDPTDPAQRRFGEYELLELLGEGGAAAVYRARHLPLERDVAVKVLSAGPWATPEFIARFGREARNAARMQHPNIVTVFEVGEHEDIHFFSMRLVEGQSLSQMLKNGTQFAPKAAAALIRTVAEAVAYAHSLGVLHLDLKPGNVLIDALGEPHVADFGLAKRSGAGLAIDNEEVSGTPAYMAPEQTVVHEQRLTAATDVWGLGAILYEVVTGHAPFLGKTARTTIDLVMRGQVRAPRRWKPSLPKDLQAVVLKCLRKDPAGRYPSARALAEDLVRFVEGRPVQARPLGVLSRAWRWARREPRLAASIAVASGLLVGGFVASTTQWRRAEVNAANARQNLWSARTQSAQQALAAGDGFRSLRPLVANVVEMEAAGFAAKAALERQRIGTILANAPQLVGLLRLPPGEVASSVAIAPDGRGFAVATVDWSRPAPTRFVRQYDMRSLRETWSASTNERTFLMAYGDAAAPHGGLRYSADGRHLLVGLIGDSITPAPHYADMIALDAATGAVLWPGALAERHADIVYDDVLQHALVRYRSDDSLRWPDSAQFYQVEGWKRIGPRHVAGGRLDAEFWLPAPGGAVWLGTRDSTNLALYSIPGLVPRWWLRLPDTSLVRAWQFSHDGRWLALGSVDGAVRIVATEHGRASVLGSGPASRVLRVAFSADDRTLVALDADGQLWSLDVATRAARAGPLRLARNDGVAATVAFAGDTVYDGGTTGDDSAEIAYATLAPPAPFNNQPVDGAVRVHGVARFGAAFDVSAAANRLVAATGDDLVTVWRLPPSPLLAAHAAPLQPLVQAFDGTRVVAVDGSIVRAIRIADGMPDSPALRHPEPVRFADFSPDGQALVTIAGRTVRIIDAHTWNLRGAPLVLAETPERVAFAAAAPVLVIAASAYAAGARRTRVERIDVRNAKMLGKTVQIDAIRGLEIDPSGQHAFVATWSRSEPAAFKWIDLANGTPVCTPKLAEGWIATLGNDGRTGWFVDVGKDDRSHLELWDLEACRRTYSTTTIPLGTAAVVKVHAGKLMVHRAGEQALVTIDARGHQLAAVGERIDRAMHEFAVSGDGERVAIATRNSVYLFDAAGGRRLSAPLAAPIAGDDAIAKLVFSPDGGKLLARTINHRWLFWNLPIATQASPDLQRLARVLNPTPSLTPTDFDLSMLRARLAGERTPPPPPGVGAHAPITFAPVPGAMASPRFLTLDLSRVVNVPMLGRRWSEPFAGGDLPTLAPGLQRFDGIDYRIDGGVQLSGGGTATAIGPVLRRSAIVPVADVVARRVYVLALMHFPMAPDVTPRAFATVVLTGADGRAHRLEISTVKDVVPEAFGPRAFTTDARVALVTSNSEIARTGEDPTQRGATIYAVALEVPRGIGPIRSLRFEVPAGPMEAPLLYAATIERAPADAEATRNSARRPCAAPACRKGQRGTR